MSEENAESVRRALDAVNRRDHAAWVAATDPELLNVPPKNWPESAPTRGREDVWNFFIQTNQQWEDCLYTHGELIDAGDDGVVAWVRGEMHGKASGADVPWSFWQVVKLRDGKITQIDWFLTRPEALEAACVSE